MFELIEKLKTLVWNSQVFDARKKWIIIKHINDNELTESQIEGMIAIFQNEANYIKQATENADKQYLQDLKQWQQELEHIVNNVIPQHRVKQEGLANRADEKAGEDLLAELNNL